jgi:hypothetical protein
MVGAETKSLAVRPLKLTIPKLNSGFQFQIFLFFKSNDRQLKRALMLLLLLPNLHPSFTSICNNRKRIDQHANPSQRVLNPQMIELFRL